MIKFTATAADGGKVLFLGLTDRNIELMVKRRRPVRIIGKEVGCDHDLFIFYGSTEQAIINELRRAGVQFPSADNVHKHDDDDRQEGSEH
jgi:hypothetical protein